MSRSRTRTEAACLDDAVGDIFATIWGSDPYGTREAYLERLGNDVDDDDLPGNSLVSARRIIARR